MGNKICSALANAAKFRADQGDVARAEELLRKAIQLAEYGGSTNDRFFAWVELAHFLEDHLRDHEAEEALRNAIDCVPLMEFGLRHSLALRELGALVMRLGRPEEGLALEALAFQMFDVLSDDVALRSVQHQLHRAS